MKSIILELAESMGTTVSAIIGKSRKRELVIMRQITAYCIKQITGNSLKSIGEAIGGRDHTTIIHSINTILNLRATNDKLLMAYVNKLPHRYKALINNESCAVIINSTLRIPEIKFPSIKYRA